MSDAPVLFSEVPSSSSQKIALITLNAEKTLNALTLDMVDLLNDRLRKWQTDPRISCVFIQGAGAKALCAGGDIQRLYQSAIERPGGPCEYAETFFLHEYRLDYLLHTYKKPIVCWGHGIVMGGGLGILSGCSHRVVTEKTRMAMPEVTIGLFPDVGGSWFLNKMPGRLGLFLALTAAQMNASDCIYAGIADYFIENTHKEAVLDNLAAIEWNDDPAQHQEQIANMLLEFVLRSQTSKPQGNIEPHFQIIEQLTDRSTLVEIVNAITAHQSRDEWLSAASSSLANGSPVSVGNIAQALEKTKQMSLAEVFQFELMLATNVIRHPEFAEGVRALLIDKDKAPQWLFDSVGDVPEELLQQMVTPPWDINPLVSLD